MRVTLATESLTLEVEEGELTVPVEVRGTPYAVDDREALVIPLEGQGMRIAGMLGDRPHTGGTRADGSRITAGVPDPIGDPFAALAESAAGPDIPKEQDADPAPDTSPVDGTPDDAPSAVPASLEPADQ